MSYEEERRKYNDLIRDGATFPDPGLVAAWEALAAAAWEDLRGGEERLTLVPDHVWRYQQGNVHLAGCCVHPGVALEGLGHRPEYLVPGEYGPATERELTYVYADDLARLRELETVARGYRRSHHDDCHCENCRAYDGVSGQ